MNFFCPPRRFNIWCYKPRPRTAVGAWWLWLFLVNSTSSVWRLAGHVGYEQEKG